MNIAVIKVGGKQYKVKEGDELRIEKIAVNKDGKMEFDDMLGGKKVNASLLDEVKSSKVRVFKFKSKTGYRRTKGHRQKYLKIKIEKISG